MICPALRTSMSRSSASSSSIVTGPSLSTKTGAKARDETLVCPSFVRRSTPAPVLTRMFPIPVSTRICSRPPRTSTFPPMSSIETKASMPVTNTSPAPSISCARLLEVSNFRLSSFVMSRMSIGKTALRRPMCPQVSQRSSALAASSRADFAVPPSVLQLPLQSARLRLGSPITVSSVAGSWIWTVWRSSKLAPSEKLS